VHYDRRCSEHLSHRLPRFLSDRLSLRLAHCHQGIADSTLLREDTKPWSCKFSKSLLFHLQCPNEESVRSHDFVAIDVSCAVRLSREILSEEMIHLFVLYHLSDITTQPPASKRARSRNQPRWLPNPTSRRLPEAKTRLANSLLKVAAGNARRPPAAMYKDQGLPSAR